MATPFPAHDPAHHGHPLRQCEVIFHQRRDAVAEELTNEAMAVDHLQRRCGQEQRGWLARQEAGGPLAVRGIRLWGRLEQAHARIAAGTVRHDRPQEAALPAIRTIAFTRDGLAIGPKRSAPWKKPIMRLTVMPSSGSSGRRE